MNHFSKKLSFVLIAVVVALSGCAKKPQRPDPSATMLGQGGSGGAGGGLVPQDIDAGMIGLTDDSASGLEQRPEGYYEDDQMIRGLLEPVYFAFDQAGIQAAERTKLQAAQEYLSNNPQHRLLLEGHADWRGTAEYNLGLGERRAGAARQYLTSIGVDAGRIETSSKGDLDAVENASDSQMAEDRRVDLIILKQ